ncbi:MAG: precorrin-6y C5,15-methyltransferase (decarboxylating) subunit CbiE [Thermodesulforhabdaceae bacterium]
MKTVSPEDWASPLVVIVGTGMIGEIFQIPQELENWLKQADVIVCGESFLKAVGRFDCEKIIIRSPLEPVIERIKEISQIKKVLIMASGDPLFYGIGRQIGETLGRSQIMVVPGITSLQYLFSKLALPWDDVLPFSLHKEDRRDFFYWLRLGRKIAILTSPARSPSFIAELLEYHRMGEMVEMVIGENLGTHKEKITTLIPAEATSKHWESPNIVAILPRCIAEKTGGFLIEDEFLHDRGMITKQEVRALAVSALRLRPGDVLWDIGAGSGSVSIEACYRVPLRAVHSVEKNPHRFEQLKANIRNFHCGEIIPYLGNILEFVDKLPPPDRIFIGGAGKDLGLILEAIIKRFGKDGMPLILISAVLWHSVSEALQVAQNYGFRTNLVQAQIARSVPLAESFRFEPLTPVFLITLEP